MWIRSAGSWPGKIMGSNKVVFMGRAVVLFLFLVPLRLGCCLLSAQAVCHESGRSRKFIAQHFLIYHNCNCNRRRLTKQGVFSSDVHSRQLISANMPRKGQQIDARQPSFAAERNNCPFDLEIVEETELALAQSQKVGASPTLVILYVPLPLGSANTWWCSSLSSRLPSLLLILSLSSVLLVFRFFNTSPCPCSLSAPYYVGFPAQLTLGLSLQLI